MTDTSFLRTSRVTVNKFKPFFNVSIDTEISFLAIESGSKKL